APAGGFSIQTTACCTPPLGPSTRSSASFSLPQMYWSIVTGTFGRCGSGPVKETLPVMSPAYAAAPVERQTAYSNAVTARRWCMRDLLLRPHYTATLRAAARCFSKGRDRVARPGGRRLGARQAVAKII